METADEPKDKEAPRDRGGQTSEDRAKGFGGQEGPFDEPEANPKPEE
jgi:hypothetical protein